MQLKREVLRTGRGARQTMRATLPGGARYGGLVVEAKQDSQERITGVCRAALAITAQQRVEDALKQTDHHCHGAPLGRGASP